MPDRDYSHRQVVDKLGVKPGLAVALVSAGGEIEEELQKQVADRTGRAPADMDESVDIVLAAIDAQSNVADLLGKWRPRLRPNGGIWLLSPKRGRPGYIKQESLIPIGLASGLVDNKICSISDAQSATRFVIRRRDRGT